MFSIQLDGSFASWRNNARQALLAGWRPEQVHWQDEHSEPSLFAPLLSPASQPSAGLRVSSELMHLLEQASSYRGAERWSLLYRILWRFVHGQRSAVLAGDIDGSQLHQRIKAVRREVHHLHAFVRFQNGQSEGAADFVAWFEPQHDVLKQASQHFIERLGKHSWLIATPLDGILFDGTALHYERHCPAQWQHWAQEERRHDQALWRAYYSSTFNPARLNPRALSQHMPLRYWKNLPEALLISQLMSQARAGAQRDGQSVLLTGKQGKRIARSPHTSLSASSDPDHPH